MTTKNLFTPLTLGRFTLSNRILMAPLTRCRATADDHIPSDAMVQHYADRASSGLIITECTMITPNSSTFWTEPGVYSPEQLAAWKKVTDAVHAKGGTIFLQIWHGGRAAHPDLNRGADNVAPSAIAIDGDTHGPNGKVPHAVPRPLTLNEISDLVGQFATAAKNAVEVAGFDGVEVHGANGYLIDQFLQDGSNTRDDAYGGSIENRARFLREILTAVSDAIGADRVGVRFSPAGGYNSMTDSDPNAVATYLAQTLNAFNLAYVHIRRGGSNEHLAIYRKHYKGVLIGNQSYTRDEANDAIAAGELDAVAFGAAYVANPDLVARFEKNAPLNQGNPNTYFVQSLEGYNDYPTLEEATA
ncbi:N-ethylmaleimide reductase [Saprolegnia diclina VS20]|uniref:N-ethylmaleimide reductase n=1 Tax=Saprolegnia diclina (strain VS20) TaxID=1156394 RepID=T0PYD9_SAPDV|nr:N-ethylmaleimide reductase [Saprolegnia diclina VS20]EQC26075.1 N-ethylmaleimide reductase [Saprolegnia diclina VS20]|eukprot:XP_008620512.1 N-ethylmaleimide reductase [Saprolegnia diclina VS20]